MQCLRVGIGQIIGRTGNHQDRRIVGHTDVLLVAGPSQGFYSVVVLLQTNPRFAITVGARVVDTPLTMPGQEIDGFLFLPCQQQNAGYQVLLQVAVAGVPGLNHILGTPIFQLHYNGLINKGDGRCTEVLVHSLGVNVGVNK